jgi:outer membrane immunogenic protein
MGAALVEKRRLLLDCTIAAEVWREADTSVITVFEWVIQIDDSLSHQQNDGICSIRQKCHSRMFCCDRCGLYIAGWTRACRPVGYRFPHVSNKEGLPMMKRSFVLSAVLTCVLIGSAMAADMPTKSPVYRPEAFSWSGFYIGAVAGAGIVTPQFNDGQAFIAGDRQAGDWAFTGGGTVGYNWQSGSAVFGVETDFNWTNFDQSVTAANVLQFDAKWNWFSTVRARFGLALDRTLVYATAGVAIVDLDYQAFRVNLGCGPTPNPCAKLSKTEVGLALGAGVEYALAGNWSFKAEYLFIKLPTEDIGLSFVNSPVKLQYTTDAHFARVGLNYRFGGVGARY